MCRGLAWAAAGAACLAAMAAAAETPRVPFPAHVTYASGTIQPSNHTQAQMDENVRLLYAHWKTKYLKSAGTDGEGKPMYRVTLGKENPKYTVSEGQGYGMIIVATLAGEDPAAQEIFDGLLRFALANPSEIDGRLMNWHVPEANDSGVDSAFDGDADIVYALQLADAQWGSSGNFDYAAQATTRLAGVKQSTLGPQSRLPLLGDWVEPNGSDHNQYTPRSSDFMPGHFHSWARLTGDPTWNTVAANCANLTTTMQANFSANTGLLPDFIIDANTAPEPAPPDFLEGEFDGDYYFNACRDPWRLAVDALLNNDATSAAQAKKISAWAEGVTGGNAHLIQAGYTLAGNPLTPEEPDFNTAFVAPLAVAAMLDPKQQTWLNTLYDAIRVEHQDYYEDSINLLCQLVLSRNFWDPTLLGAPVITTQPQAETVVAGRSATFSVTATGTGALRYQWYFNGNAVPGTRQSYMIHATQAKSAGNYSVKVTDAAGTTTSENATLTLLKSATRARFTLQPNRTVTVAANGTVTLIVAASGTGPLKYQWQRQFQNLTDDGTTAGTKTATLTITNATRANAGLYRVLATNPAGTTPSQSCRVTVQ
jgi:hypothetical protein